MFLANPQKKPDCRTKQLDSCFKTKQLRKKAQIPGTTPFFFVFIIHHRLASWRRVTPDALKSNFTGWQHVLAARHIKNWIVVLKWRNFPWDLSRAALGPSRWIKRGLKETRLTPLRQCTPSPLKVIAEVFFPLRANKVNLNGFWKFEVMRRIRKLQGLSWLPICWSQN